MTLDDLAPAVAVSETALAGGKADAYDLGILALASALHGRRDEAEQLFHRARSLDLADPSPLVFLAIWRRQEGRLRDALLAADEAIAMAPDYADAWMERGASLAAGGSSAAARVSFERAAELAPQSARAHAAVASLAARDGDTIAAKRHADTALAIDPSNAVAINALSALALERGDTDTASSLASRVAASSSLSLERSHAHSLLGDAAARSGDSDTAYSHYVCANQDYAALKPNPPEGAMDQTAFIQALDRGLAQSLPDWRAAYSGPEPQSAAQRHIFLLGYPRSGTTMLENVLASVPGVHALEERPTFRALDEELLTGDAEATQRALHDFARWDDERLAVAAHAYWDTVTASGIPAAADAFVDMDPLKGTRLPFISRLFPQARVIVLRRDPRDVIWSCFRTNFALTSNTLEFISLERTARHYDALMQLTDRAMDNLPLNVLEVDYQRLVRDFDTVTRQICAFTGLEWSEDLRRFDRTASRRGVGTASATQVRRGLYDGSGQWRPFAKFFEPVLPILAPWIERFGSEP